MRPWWGLGAGLAALGALAWLIFSGTPGTGRSASHRATEAGSRASAALQAPLRIPSPVSTSEPALLAIQGTVIGPKGPVSGARVLASMAVPGETLSTIPCHGFSKRSLLDCVTLGRPRQQQVQQWVEARHGEALVRAETVTAEDGTFSLSGLEAGPYALWVESSEGVGFRPEVIAGAAPVELRLGEGALLSGSVTDDAKVPAPGALVTAVSTTHSRFFEALTDATGHFQIGPLPQGEFVLVVSKKDLLAAVEPLVAYTHEVKRDFELFRPRSVQGRVLLSKEPVPGVDVRATDEFGQEFSTITDAKGRFSLEGLAAENYELTAQHAGKGASQMIQLRDMGAGKAITLELRPAVFIEGVVRDENHQPLKGVDVDVEGTVAPESVEQEPEESETQAAREEEAWDSRFASTNEDGRYRLGPLPPGRYQFRASVHGYLEQKEEARELTADVTNWDVTLRRALMVEGALVDPSGRPIEDESVELRSIDAEGTEWDSNMTRADGHFSLAVSHPGTFQLKLGGQRVHPLELNVTVPAEPLRIVAEPLLRLEGEVVNETGTPLPQIAVALWPEAADLEERALDRRDTDNQGKFSLPVSTAGRYLVVAELIMGDIVRYASQVVEVHGEGKSGVQLRFETGRPLSGVMVDWRGRPLPKVPVQLLSAPRSLNPYRCDIPHMCVETDDDGRFTFREASGEQFDVCVRKEGYSPLAAVHEDGDSGCVRVKNNGQEVRIVVGRDVFVTGRVVHPDGSPVTQFRVNGREVRREDGEISLLIHQPGVEQIELSAPGLQTVLRTAPDFQVGVEIEDLGTIVLSP
jgi:protocatechuate 3,4-dioxygenase beta subunit